MEDQYKQAWQMLTSQLSQSTQKGLPMFASGILFWFVAGIAGVFFPEEAAVWVYIFGTAMVFPLGILLSKIFGADLMNRHNPLAMLCGLIGGLQLLFAPIVILALIDHPQWMPLIVGVLTGAHFLPFVAIYRSRTYLFQSIGTVAAAALCGISVHSYQITPFAIMAVYVVTFIGLAYEQQRKER
ncbi:DUF7010 family protein [Paenibacillus pinihumi]|uniref:DUF7010 family protein n=1 Tax=Paenibacillus pinihumi TaxID=669462 RepID=UPI0004265B35|nr:hypothetical protein [Paenibacillus pinihumi]